MFASGLRTAGFLVAAGTGAGFVVGIATRDLVDLVLDSADAGAPLIRAEALVVVPLLAIVKSRDAGQGTCGR